MWWQEWSNEVLEYAAGESRILFVSVGYSVCYWCHVMAQDAFSDSGVSEILNKHFVSIKVDREERPDIDKFLMWFFVDLTGSGGWPLNVFLSPDLKPLYALTYAPSVSNDMMPSFTDMLIKIKEFYVDNCRDLSGFEMNLSAPDDMEDADLSARLFSAFDKEYG